MSKVEHLVVLMLENRSFDCMLGHLYPKSDAFDGVAGDEANPWHKPDGTVDSISVWNDHGMSPETACIPDPDPGEWFDDMNTQIFGLNGTSADPATMSGFVDDYMRQPEAERAYPKAVMHVFTPRQVPVISRLATAFGVSDRWFASAPCETWPNRFFAHTGSARGWVNNVHPHFPQVLPCWLPSIFRRLGKHGRSWKIYFHDMPQAAALLDLWTRLLTHFRLFEEFLADARNGQLPNYSFIEPRYFPSLQRNCVPNDGHPPHNVVYAEQLIAAVYNAVRQAPTWDKTLLLITCDEHGGCFDHVPPPPAVSPGGPYPDGFYFDRYGVRVPAVLVSPYIPQGSVIRPPAAADGKAGHPFDHTSILATLQTLFALGPALTPRAAVAPDLLFALTLETPANHGPAAIEAPRIAPSSEHVRALARAPRNHHQRSLRHPLILLPGLLAQAAGHFHHARRLRADRSTP
jgi:phospholipase C